MGRKLFFWFIRLAQSISAIVRRPKAGVQKEYMPQTPADDSDTLIHQLGHADYRVRLSAVHTLAARHDAQFIPWLIRALCEFDPRDEESHVNFTAGDALIKLGEPALLPLRRALQELENQIDTQLREWQRDFIQGTLHFLQMELSWHKPDALHRQPTYDYYRALLKGASEAPHVSRSSTADHRKDSDIVDIGEE
jgi:hypothetical protein